MVFLSLRFWGIIFRKVLHFTKNNPENIDLQQFSGLKDGLFDGK